MKTDLRSKGLNPNEFIIYEIESVNDSILGFHLNHIDSYVYNYNRDKLISYLSRKHTGEGFIEEVPPITGNISGHEGWYIVNLEKENIQISHAQ